MRVGDRTGHDDGSDVFVIVMTAPARALRTHSPIAVRSVLERVAAAMSVRVEMRIETGWLLLREFHEGDNLERELAAALERGARERERFEFFAAIGHELRTPLTSIRGYLETLLDGQTDPETTKRFLQIARRETLRMTRLLEGMFEFSLLDIANEAYSGATCPLGEQIDRACEIIRPLAAQHDVHIITECNDDAQVGIDADACVQMLVNLLDNAVKYGRSGGSVRVASMALDDEILVTVDDDGPGITAMERESIFALRRRGAQAESRPGTGIGLAIVKMIAERAGGRVRVDDSPLGGARFAVTLRKAESAALTS